MRFITDLPVNEFIALLKAAACLVGNSSAGIKECSYLGTPVVNIGARQQGRLHADNVAHVGVRRGAILDAVRRADRARPLRAVEHLLPARPRARRSSTCLPALELYTQKRFFDNAAATRAQVSERVEGRP